MWMITCQTSLKEPTFFYSRDDSHRKALHSLLYSCYLSLCNHSLPFCNSCPTHNTCNKSPCHPFDLARRLTYTTPAIMHTCSTTGLEAVISTVSLVYNVHAMYMHTLTCTHLHVAEATSPKEVHAITGQGAPDAILMPENLLTKTAASPSRSMNHQYTIVWKIFC